MTLEDLFEELGGNITERPDELPEITPERAGRVRADAAARIEDVGEALDVVLAHEEVDTVSGLVLALLGRPPHIGDVVSCRHVQFEVTAVRGHGVESVLAAVLSREPNGRDG